MTSIEGSTTLATACAARIRDAEAQPRNQLLALSARDGRLLRRVPAAEHLTTERVAEALASAFDTQPLWREVVELIGAVQSDSGQGDVRLRRCCAAWLRSLAYLSASNTHQAQLDINMALALSKQSPAGPHDTTNTTSSSSSSRSSSSGSSNTAATRHAVWRAACGLLAAAVACEQQEWAQAALQLQQLVEWEGPSAALQLPAPTLAAVSYPDPPPPPPLTHKQLHTHADPHQVAPQLQQLLGRLRQQAAAQLQQRVVGCLTPAQAAALVQRGAAGLVGQLAEEEEEALPELLRPHPRWYYYNKWMASRIAAVYPQLPPPVVTKLLSLDAGDLDTLLTHPLALHGQVLELLDVWEEGGEAALSTHTPELLTWEEMTALCGPLTGVPLGHTPPPEVVAAQQQLVQALHHHPHQHQALDAASSSSSSLQEVLCSPNTSMVLSSNRNSCSVSISHASDADFDNHAGQHSLPMASQTCEPLLGQWGTDTLPQCTAPGDALGTVDAPAEGAATTSLSLQSTAGPLGRPLGWSGSRRQFVLQYGQQLACCQQQAHQHAVLGGSV